MDDRLRRLTPRRARALRRAALRRLAEIKIEAGQVHDPTDPELDLAIREELLRREAKVFREEVREQVADFIAAGSSDLEVAWAARERIDAREQAAALEIAAEIREKGYY